MALGDKGKERRQAAELALWQAERDRVRSFISRAETFTGATNAEVPSLPLELAEGEHALLVLPGVRLIEPRRLPAHFMGGDGGFSFHVARAPRSRDSGDDDPTPIDTGVVTVTDRRAVFSGSLHLRTWDYSLVIGFHSHEQPPWTAIAVSDRQKISGLSYDAAHAEEFRFALALGLARCHHAEASLINDLHRQLDEIDRDRPGGIAYFDTPVAPATQVAPASMQGPPSWASPTAASPRHREPRPHRWPHRRWHRRTPPRGRPTPRRPPRPRAGTPTPTARPACAGGTDGPGRATPLLDPLPPVPSRRHHDGVGGPFGQAPIRSGKESTSSWAGTGRENR